MATILRNIYGIHCDGRCGLVLHGHRLRVGGLTAVMVGHRQVDGVAVIANHRHGSTHRAGGGIRGRGSRRNHYPTRPSVRVVGRGRRGDGRLIRLRAVGRTHRRNIGN